LRHMADLLSDVYTTLRAAAAHPANAERAQLLRVLADLVDENGVFSWAEIPDILQAKAPIIDLGFTEQHALQLQLDFGTERNSSPASFQSQRTQDTVMGFPTLPEVVRYNTNPGPSPTCSWEASGSPSGLRARIRSLSPSTPMSTCSTVSRRRAQLFGQGFGMLVQQPSTPAAATTNQAAESPGAANDLLDRPRSYVPPVVPKTASYGAPRVTGQPLSYVPPSPTSAQQPQPPRSPVYAQQVMASPTFFMPVHRRMSYATSH